MSLSGLTRNSSGSDSSRSPLDNAAQKYARASAAAETAAQTAPAAAAAEGHGSSKPSKASESAGGSASAGCEVWPVPDLEGSASPGEALQARLGRYLRHMHIHTVVTAMCIVNTLTPRQMATLSVGEEDTRL